MTLPSPQTIYLDADREPVSAIFHPAETDHARDTAVILCPPFGWDEVCSYRSRREWGRRLAADGYPTIRFSFPATGDSASVPRDPDRLEAWTTALDRTAHWLQAATASRRIVVIGMGLSGLVAYRAAAAGAPIDDLVLWATPAKGRAFVRQLRAFSKLEVSQFFEGLEQPPPLPPGELEAGGFLLSAQTVRELDALDLTALPLVAASSRRVLLLERDGIAVDGRLREHLEVSGATVTVAAGNGYEAMTSHPQHARPPLEVIARVSSWLGEASRPASANQSSVSLPAQASYSAEIQIGDGAGVRETPVTIEQPFGNLTGVLVEPLDPGERGLCAVLLNAGAVRRIGPSRMWVEVARRWAARGVPTLRLDVEGIGDSDGDETPYTDDGALYVPTLVPQVLAALDFLEDRGVGDSFLVGGLCAGAYWSFHAALRDPRVSGAIMLNPRALIWDTGLLPARDFRALLTERPSLSKIVRVASVARVRALALWVLGAPKRWFVRLRSREARAAAAGADTDAALEQLRASRKRALLLFSADEPLHEELVRSGRLARMEWWESVTLEYIAVRDHTLRPGWSQGQAHEALDRALERELQFSRPTAPAPSA